MLHSITKVVRGVPDPWGVARAWVADLGYVPVARGQLAADEAAAWGAPGLAGRAFATVAPAQGERVDLVFYEAPDAGPKSHGAEGWNVVEITIGDVQALFKRVKAGKTRFSHYADPLVLPMNEFITGYQVLGPEGAMYYFTEITPSPKTQHLPLGTKGTGRVFIMVMGVKSLGPANEFFERRFANSRIGPLRFASDAINEAQGLPKGHEIVMGLVRLPGKFSIEVDELGPQAAARVAPEGLLAPGIGLVGFSVSQITDQMGPFIVPPALRRGRKTAVIEGPGGARMELEERPA